MRLGEILEEYKKALSMLREDGLILYSTGAPREIKEGFVYETAYRGTPVLLLLANIEGEFAEVVPLCFMWELATRYDYLLEFEHPLRDTWIAQLDLAAEIPKEMLFQFKEVGRINENDLRTIKSVLADESEIPEEKKGKGYEDEVHAEFKKLEYERHRWLYESLLLSLDEEEEKLLISEPLREEFEKLSSLPLAADAIQTVANLPFGKLVYIPEENRAELLFKKELLENQGHLYVSMQNRTYTLYFGKLRDFSLPNVSKKVFNILKNLQLEIRNGKNQET
jgi:hypothetical protein